MLEEEIQDLGPQRKSEVEAAQQLIIETAKKLESEGKLSIQRGGNDDIIE